MSAGLTADFEEHPVWSGALAGALTILVLPLIVIIWKIDLCSYGLTSDLSGVVCLGPFMAAGAVIGAICGAVGQGISSLLTARTSVSNPKFIGSASGMILAVAAAFIASFVPAFMFWFPDC